MAVLIPSLMAVKRFILVVPVVSGSAVENEEMSWGVEGAWILEGDERERRPTLRGVRRRAARRDMVGRGSGEDGEVN